MKVNRTIAAAAAALTLAVVPALALASSGNGPPAWAHNQQGPSGTSGPSGPSGPTGPNPNGHAWGVRCRGELKKHVKGMKGTPFSQCVTAMAKASHGATPHAACKGELKKHVKGMKGTPFSRCVSAAAKLQKDLKSQS